MEQRATTIRHAPTPLPVRVPALVLTLALTLAPLPATGRGPEAGAPVDPSGAGEPSASTAPVQTPAAVRRLLFARPFTIERPFPFTWRAERPPVRTGTMLVIEVDPALLRPRQTAEPVLYVGAHTAWRVSPYNAEGIVVAFVPARVDLTRSPVWFGTPELPERVDAWLVERESSLARSAGIAPFDRAAVDAATGRGRSEVPLGGKADLLNALHELVLEFIPRR